MTPPAMALLLSTSLTSDAIAYSGARGGHGANNGYGNGGGDASPNGKNEHTADEGPPVRQWRLGWRLASLRMMLLQE